MRSVWHHRRLMSIVALDSLEEILDVLGRQLGLTGVTQAELTAEILLEVMNPWRIRGRGASCL